MAAEAGRLNIERLDRMKKRKTSLTRTGLLMEGVRPSERSVKQ
jgi:hypothetical protein